MSIIDNIACRIAAAAGVTVDDLREKSRAEPLPFIRQLIMWAGIANGATYKGVGRYLNRDHSTVIWGVRKISELLGEPTGIRALNAEMEMSLLMQAATPPREPQEFPAEERCGQLYSIVEDGLVLALVGLGYSYHRVGRFLDRGGRSVEHRLKYLGAMRPVPPSRAKGSAIEQAWLKGESSMREIGSEHGVSKSLVSGVIRRRGLSGKKGAQHVQ